MKQIMMTQEKHLEQIQQELIRTPAEYLPALLNIIHTFRESISHEQRRGKFQDWLVGNSKRTV